MDSLSIIVLVTEIILFLSLSVLAVYLIFAVKKLVRSAESVEKNTSELQEKLSPVLVNALEVSDNMKVVSGEVRKQIAKVNDIVESVKETTESIIEFEQKAQKQLETPVFESLSLVSAVYTGVKTFIKRLTDSTNNRSKTRSIDYVSED